MRKIKFRGIRTDGKGFIYGDLYQDGYSGKDFITEFIGIESGESITELREVHPETVGQFTGLLDKNGKEIFEGDVIQLTREEEYGELIYITDNKYTYETSPIPNRIFETLTFMDFIYTVMYSEDHGGLWGRSPEYIEVIGTIHDGKEVES